MPLHCEKGEKIKTCWEVVNEMTKENKPVMNITCEIEMKFVILLPLSQECKQPRNKSTIIIISSLQILRPKLKFKWCQKYEPTFRPKFLNFEFRWECEVEIKVLLAATQREKSGSGCEKSDEIKTVKTVETKPNHDENKKAGKEETAETSDTDAGFNKPPQSPGSSDAGSQAVKTRFKVKPTNHGNSVVKISGQASQNRPGVRKSSFQFEVQQQPDGEPQICHSFRARKRRPRQCCARSAASRRSGGRRRSSSRWGGGRRKEGKEGRKGRERRRQRCSLAHLQEKEKENEESKTKENRKSYKNINKKSFYQNNPVYKKLKKCCDKTKYQGICDISQSELSNRCHNSEHTPHTPLSSPLTPFNGSINENENESMEPRQSTCVTSDNSVKIFAENRNKENNTVQDDIHEYPSNGENFDNRISPKFFYSHVMLYTHVVKQCLQMISSVLVTKNMFRRYLSFVYCNLVAIMKCCFEMFS